MDPPATGSERALGLLEATTPIMGSMIGSGIFLAPELIAGILVESRLGSGTFVLISVRGVQIGLSAAVAVAFGV